MRVELSPEVLARYEGTYQNEARVERRITHDGARLFSQRGQSPLMELVPFSANGFFFKDMPLYQLRFVSDANEVVIAVEMCGRSGIPEIAKRVDEVTPGTA